jgi:NADPH-dependent 2,4-dienoyl-CoA reductase/sulfur reductase-like enzyme
VVDEETGARVHAAHRRHGVDIRLGTSLKSAATTPDVIEAVTNFDERMAADLVVVGIGSVPDTALASAAGLAVDNGIVVDERCCTSDASIFAAGDVVRFPGPRGLVRLENWRHAQDQGLVAGKNAAGAFESYNVAPSFWSEQYDLYVQGVGWPTPNTRQVRRALPGASRLLFELLDDHLVYAMGINAQRDLATARRLIERKIPVDASELADPTRPLAPLLKR